MGVAIMTSRLTPGEARQLAADIARLAGRMREIEARLAVVKSSESAAAR
jgi:hypothetical protein